MNVGKFILNVVVAFIAYGILYQGGMSIMADSFASAKAMMRPDEEIMIPTLAYHLVQTAVVVWLFGKAVGSGDIKAGAVFGFMMGLYLMATQATWFTAIRDFPQDGRMVANLMDLVIGAIVGMLLAFMWGKGLGSGAAEEAVAQGDG